MSPDYEKAAAKTIPLLGGCLGNTVLNKMRRGQRVGESKTWDQRAWDVLLSEPIPIPGTLIPSTAKLPDQLAAPLASYWERKEPWSGKQSNQLCPWCTSRAGYTCSDIPGQPRNAGCGLPRDMNIKSGVRNSTNPWCKSPKRVIQRDFKFETSLGYIARSKGRRKKQTRRNVGRQGGVEVGRRGGWQ